MGKASRDKGKRGELLACQIMEKLVGGQWVRWAPMQASKKLPSPDVYSPDHTRLFCEVKFTIRPQPYKALLQAIADAPSNTIPMALVKTNLKPWAVILRLEDLPQLAKYIEDRQHLVPPASP